MYGLIHARFILSRPGLEAMGEKYARGEFGTCPRYLCGKASCLPVGTSDKIGSDTVAVYCARCLDIYKPREVSLA